MGNYPDFRALDANRDLMWSDVAAIDWDKVPVTGGDDIVWYARSVAGTARNFPEYYKRENADKHYQIDMWLTRYSAQHTHPDLRK